MSNFFVGVGKTTTAYKNSHGLTVGRSALKTYRGFSLKIEDSYCAKILKELNSTRPHSNFLNSRHTSVTDPYPIKSILKNNIVGSKSLNAEKIKGEWFPIIESDIFISHSHRDIETVTKLAEILSKHLGLKVFVDSEVWKYSEDLVQQIECQCHEGGYFIHDKIVAHVNIMLASALTKMLNNTECVIFLNTSNSLIPDQYSTSHQTDSPWIYHELFTTSLLPIRTPKRKMEKSVVNEASQFEIAHTVPLEHLTNLSDVEFENWTIKAKNIHWENALDALYNLKPAKIRRSNLYG